MSNKNDKSDEPIEYPNTFAGRRAQREAEGRPAKTKYEPRGTIRAGVDEVAGEMSVTRVDR